MQSSTAIAIRALIMLIVLISVPLFAIFGKSLPDVVKGLLEGRGLVLGPAPEATASSTPAAPLPASNNPFSQPASYRAGGAGSSGPMSASATSVPGSTSPAAAASPTASIAGPATPPSNVLLAGNSSVMNGQAVNGQTAGTMSPDRLGAPPTGPTSPAASLGSVAVAQAGVPSSMQTPPATPAAPPTDWRMPPSMGATPPGSFQSPPDATAMQPTDMAQRDSLPSTSGSAPQTDSPYAAKVTPAIITTTTPASSTSATPSVGDEKFRQAEARLRELGATHYMLETWGTDSNRYHFVCKMSIAGNAEVNRVFQAFGDNPWQAMETVLRQVEDWRARPQQ